MGNPRNKDRWQLTAETFRSLIANLGADETLALERYQRLQQRLVFFFMRYRFIAPEDLADLVVNRIARALHEEREILNIEAFALGVARMVAREEQARLIREQQSYREVERNRSSPAHTSIESQRKLGAMETQLKGLSEDVKLMLLSYHEGQGVTRIRARQRLASELGITIGALRKRVHDLHATLRNRLTRALEEPDQTPENKGESYL